MKKDIKKTQTFISRMPIKMHKELRFIAMYTGQTMQQIGNYAIQKEIELFKTQIPALKELSDSQEPKQFEESEKIEEEDVIDTAPTNEELSADLEEDDTQEQKTSVNLDDKQNINN